MKKMKIPRVFAFALTVSLLLAAAIPFAADDPAVPDPPYNPAMVTIADEPPFFLNDRSIENPYSHPGYNPKTAGGLLSPLIFTHTTAVHGGLVWKKGARSPKLLLSHRHSEMRANDVVDPDIIDRLINWREGDPTDWLPLGVTEPPTFTYTDESGETRTVSGALNDPRGNLVAGVRQSYNWAMYGGFANGHARSVTRRIKFDRGIENMQLWDLGHPDAFKNSGKYDIARLTDAQSLLNRRAFKDSGYSKGMVANLYCYGGTTLADGKLLGIGGNDMNSSNGLYRINVFDPETERWAPRPEGCHRAGWAAAPASDPYFTALFAPLWEAYFYDPTPANKEALYFMPGCNPIAGGNRKTVTMENGFPFIRYEGPTATQPRHRSDMRYARWYPGVLQLPDDTVLIMSGQDQDETVGSHQPVDPETGTLNVNPVSGFSEDVGDDRVDGAFGDSMIFQTVPELYNPRTDRTTAMESAARIKLPNYPHMFPVQTGPGRNDWKVVVYPGVLLSSVGGNQSYEGPYFGGTWLFDVQAAMADPRRDQPGTGHVSFIGNAHADHQNYGMAAEVLTLGRNGRTLSHKVIAFGGKSATSEDVVDTVEMIDFARPRSQWRWELQQPLYQPARATKVIPLPDGTVLIGGGVASGPILEQRASLHFQLFDPDTGSMKKLGVKTTVPKSSHGNLYMLPDATAMLTGDDLQNSVQAGDRVAPFGDGDLGVDTAQVLKPAYLFDDDGSEAERPVIEDAPDEIEYGDDFRIRVDLVGRERIRTVSLFRSGSSTHSMGSNIRLIRLGFERQGQNHLRVTAPRLPVQALPGDYTLFVVDDRGVPSVAKHVRVKLDRHGH